MIAVTGANGYVGGRILAHLRAEGIEAVALVRSSGARRRGRAPLRAGRAARGLRARGRADGHPRRV